MIAEADTELTPLIYCSKRESCCSTVYCSPEHQSLDQEHGHSLMCVGTEVKPAVSSGDGTQRAKKQRGESGCSSSSSSIHPWAAFVTHAEQQHEFFIAVAKIAAKIVQQMQKKEEKSKGNKTL